MLRRENHTLKTLHGQNDGEWVFIMTIITGFTKTDAEVLDYIVDWETGGWLAGDTIATSTWSAETGLTVDSETETTTKATVWLSGGTNDEVYVVTNQIITATGRTAERSFRLSVEER